MMNSFENRRTTDANDAVPRTGKDDVFEKVIDERRSDEELSIATAIFQWMEHRKGTAEGVGLDLSIRCVDDRHGPKNPRRETVPNRSDSSG